LNRGYPNRGEKSVNAKNVESIFSTNFPFASDFFFMLFLSGSSWKAFQFAAASRLGCSSIKKTCCFSPVHPAPSNTPHS
jgi:hypothetical protein